MVEQIEKGEISSPKTTLMLESWLKPMSLNSVDTIVLGCTHYPLVNETIKKIMGKNINLIDTGCAIAKRLKILSSEQGPINECLLNICIDFTGEINTKMVNKIFKTSEQGDKIMIRKYEI